MPAEVNKTMRIAAPVEKVWQALTQPDLLKQWLFDTEIIVQTDWVPGHPRTQSGEWYGKPYTDKGMILRYEKEKLLQYTHLSHLSQLADVQENYGIITFTLAAHGDATGLTLLHTNLVTDTIYSHNNYYWVLTLDRLKKLVDGC